MKNVSFKSSDSFPSIEPPTIPLIKKEEDIQYNNLTKINLRRTPNSAASGTYEFKMGILKLGSPEAILELMINFDKAVVGTGTTSPAVNISFLKNLLGGKATHKYNLIITSHGGTTANCLLEISRGIYKYLFPSNALAKQKRAMRCMMLKPRGLELRQFAARVQ